MPPFQNYEILHFLFLEIIIVDQLLDEFKHFATFLILFVELIIVDQFFDKIKRFLTFIFIELTSIDKLVD